MHHLTEEELSKHNKKFSTKSYVKGNDLSQEDVNTVKDILSFDPLKYPHLTRYLSHILSRTAEFESITQTCASMVSKKNTEDDVDLFGSDEEEDAEAEKLKAQRLAEYNAKKAAKGPGPVAKSSIVFDVKPWDDTTDLKKMEESVRGIFMDGLLWGASQIVPIGYGINKLQISCVVEDDKVGIDAIEEAVTGLEDFVQSMDIVSFNKI